MAGAIYEFFGYRAVDDSNEAKAAPASAECPFLGEKCEKTLNDRAISGACSIKPMTSPPVICCPIRLYADDYKILQHIADLAFETPNLELVSGPSARKTALREHKPTIGVFGKRWGGELHLPKKSGHGNYFVDWILALVSADGELQEFVAIEVQTMDTTGNYRPGRLALLDGRRELVRTTVGINWENVSKRIIPQLVYKGQVLQREELCRRGLFFVSPKPVLDHIMERLGGALPSFPTNRASITFLAYDYDSSVEASKGSIIPLTIVEKLPTSVEKLKESFNNVTLEETNVYQAAIEAALSGI
ncbi:MAG: hypothetical protein LBM94_07175 [Propionibacteriaceae bacterium]|jgi:hypothetical protein|nr:hypothetical protein [Propionibacteriaceae bacterium]